MSTQARDAGIQALKSGDPKTALQHLAEAVRQNPSDAQAYAYLGTTYGQLNLPEQAAQCLERAVALAPQSAALQFNFGIALEKAGKRDEAVAAYRRSLTLDASYERARQALARLGQAAPAAASTPPAPAPTAPSAPTAPAAGGGLSDFSLGTPATPTAPAPSPYGTPPSIYGEPTQVNAAPSPYGTPPSIYNTPAPNPYGAPPPAPNPYGAPPPAPSQEPTLYGAAAQAGVPTVYGAPAGGLQPMGDWTPPEPQGGGGLADYQTAPRKPPATATSYTPEAGAAVMTTVEHPGSSLPKSWMVGHCYLSGMTIGAWWGLIGAIVIGLNAMLTTTSSQLGERIGPVFVACLMIIALGMLIYGVVGAIGGLTDDPEQTCHYLGVGVGFVTSLFLMPMLLAMLTIGAGAMIGTIIVSRLFGKALGGRINEMQSNVFVVASAGDVALVRGR